VTITIWRNGQATTTSTWSSARGDLYSAAAGYFPSSGGDDARGGRDRVNAHAEHDNCSG